MEMENVEAFDMYGEKIKVGDVVSFCDKNNPYLDLGITEFVVKQISNVFAKKKSCVILKGLTDFVLPENLVIYLKSK